MYFDHMESPVGRLLLASDDAGVRVISFPKGKTAQQPEPDWVHKPAQLAPVRRQLEDYFDGTRTTFDLVLAPEGTPFQQAVWRILEAIPYGATLSYGDVARAISRPKASRAVGAANGANPIPIIIPCHRVIGGDGKLTGFGGGLDTKAALLALSGLTHRRSAFRANCNWRCRVRGLPTYPLMRRSRGPGRPVHR